MNSKGRGKPRWKSRAMIERVIAKLAEAETPAEQIASELKLTLTQLAEIALDEDTFNTLRGLARLAELRAQMLLARYRGGAVARLINTATCDEPSDLSRKAAVDLLKIDLAVFDKGEPVRGDDVPPAPSEEAILKALEQWGEKLEDD